RQKRAPAPDGKPMMCSRGAPDYAKVERGRQSLLFYTKLSETGSRFVQSAVNPFFLAKKGGN
ncbi:hypothetical protein, partial [Kosakonia sacchari]|uniref:hypothetical protein n=1 Tax=Kosakonia sacchari TaxID=1158459 RepID=UPI0028AB87E6